MKKIEFTLHNPVKLIPIDGETKVEVTTTGRVVIQDPAPSEEPPRERSITITDTIRGRLSSSPCGVNHTVKIILPSRMATRENFISEVNALFDQIKLNKIEMERNRG